MTVREDLRDAVTLDTVIDGQPVHVTGYLTMPDTPAVYDAWPAWDGDEWLNDCVAEETWRVLVVLPAGAPNVWTDTGDTLRGDVAAALLKFGAVRAEPVQLLVATGSPQPALQFTVTV